MPNLVQLSNELEYVPKEQLAQMSQDPSSRFPQYLVLSEIQRRTANEKAYAAAKPQPTTTVAEEVVGEFIQPKGLQAGMPSGSAPTDIFSSESIGMPASAPMQQPMQQPMMGMAEGGLTEYMEEVNSELKRIKEKESRYAARNKKQKEGKTIFSSSLSPRNYVIPDEEYKKLTDKGMVRAFDAYRPMGLLFNALSGEGAFSGMDRTIPESKLKNLESAMKQSRNEMQQRQQGLASGGLTAFAAGDRTALDETFYNPITNVGSSTNPYPVDETQKSFLADRYTKEDGSIDYGTAIFDGIDATALAFILAPEPTSTAIGAVTKGLSTVGRGAMNFLRSPLKTPKAAYDKAAQKIGTKKIIKGEADVPTGGTVPYNPNIARDLGKPVLNKRILQTAAVPYVGSKFLPEGEKTTKPENTETEIERQLRLQNKAQKKELDALRNKATGVAKPKKEIDYDLVGLGGLIMGSRNMSELGMGLAGLAEKKQARADALLEGQAQQDYYRASADKVRAELENLPLEQKFDILDNITETLKQAREGEIELTDERKLELNQASQLLTSQILALQGIDANSLTGLNVNEALGPKIN